MEYALRDRCQTSIGFKNTGLNPCSNGICSKSSLNQQTNVINLFSLNPCSNGICSKS